MVRGCFCANLTSPRTKRTSGPRDFARHPKKTFSTLSALFGLGTVSVLGSLLGVNQTYRRQLISVAFDLERTLALEQPAKKINLHVGQLAPVSRKHRMKVLHGANQAVAAHILVGLTIKVVGDGCDNLLCQAGPRRGLEEGQPI